MLTSNARKLDECINFAFGFAKNNKLQLTLILKINGFSSHLFLLGYNVFYFVLLSMTLFDFTIIYLTKIPDCSDIDKVYILCSYLNRSTSYQILLKMVFIF